MKKAALLTLAFLFLTVGVFAGEGKTCNMAEKSTKAVDMTGKLLCKHCNLHQQENCEKVFQPANDETTLYAVCSHSKVDLEKVGEEGTATLHIKGKLVKCAEDGKEEIMIEEATKVAEAGK